MGGERLIAKAMKVDWQRPVGHSDVTQQNAGFQRRISFFQPNNLVSSLVLIFLRANDMHVQHGSL